VYIGRTIVGLTRGSSPPKNEFPKTYRGKKGKEIEKNKRTRAPAEGEWTANNPLENRRTQTNR